jgi:16S rRNA (cytosine967-C5)-methyltransferase
MSSLFRATHLFHLLNAFEKQKLPLDVFLRIYFKDHKAIGSHDRKYIAETIYTLTRWKGLVDFFCKEDISWENRVAVLESLSPEEHLNDSSIPLHNRVSFPENYFSYLSQELGEHNAKEFCLESNYTAPITIRANALKISRDALMERLKDIASCSPGKLSPHAIHFDRRANFFGLPEFKEGLFEMQDEASQIGAFQVKARPGDHVLDYCSGAGGKALAIAPSMQGKGQIYLHDIRSQVLIEAKKRLKRAGVQNFQFILPDDPKKKRFWGRMDWVLVDAPCSGSGTLRRNPDMKWYFDQSSLEELARRQRQIFEEALKFAKPKGHIVYATCSILPIENDKQVEWFVSNLPVKLVETPFRSFPKKGEMDGFFAATLQKH